LFFVVGEVLNMRSVLNWLRTGSLAAVVWVGAMASESDAGVIINLEDTGSGTVNLTFSGFINLTGLTLNSSPSNSTSLISPSQGRIRTAGSVNEYLTGSVSPAQFFGSGSSVNATSFTGSAIRVNFSDPSSLGLPSGYTSLSAISGSGVFTGSLGSLGLTQGAYTYNWGIGGAGRSVTLNVGMAGSSAVPEPTSMAIFGLGALGFAYRNRRKLLK
jgi:hypothetical protein